METEKVIINQNEPPKKNGGKRFGAGRKVGSLGEKARTELEVKSIIHKNAKGLLAKQMMLANGVTYLYRVDTDEKGKTSKPVLVVDEWEIREWVENEINGEGSSGDSYYFITAQRPDGKAIDSMLDRAYGKARQAIEVAGDPDNPLEFDATLSPEAEGRIVAAVTQAFLDNVK